MDKSIGKIDAFGTGMREAGQKIANTFRTFADKPEKEYGGEEVLKDRADKVAYSGKEKAVVQYLKLCGSRHRKDRTACRRREKVPDRQGRTGNGQR